MFSSKGYFVAVLLTSVSTLAVRNADFFHEALTKITPMDADVMYYAPDGIRGLSDIAPAKTLTKAEHAQKIEKLKSNVRGFSPQDTLRVQAGIDRLFSIQDDSVQEVLDAIPDYIRFEPQENHYQDSTFYATYFSDKCLVGISKATLAANDVYVTQNIAHELFHAKQHVEGIFGMPPIYHTADSYTAWQLIREAEARAFDCHVAFRLNDSNTMGAKYGVQNWYGQSFRMHHSDYIQSKQSKESAGPSSETERQAQKYAEMKARGTIMRALLEKADEHWYEAYKANIGYKLSYYHKSFAKHEDKRLTAYIFNRLENKYGITHTELVESLSQTFNADLGQIVKSFRQVEDVGYMDSLHISKSLKQMKQSRLTNILANAQQPQPAPGFGHQIQDKANKTVFSAINSVKAVLGGVSFR